MLWISLARAVTGGPQGNPVDLTPVIDAADPNALIELQGGWFTLDRVDPPGEITLRGTVPGTVVTVTEHHALWVGLGRVVLEDFTLSGQGLYSPLRIESAGWVEMSGMTLRDGVAPTTFSFGGLGFVAGQGLTASGTRFESGLANQGGALSVVSPFVCDGCTFSGNVVVDGIAQGGALNVFADVTLTDALFEGNVNATHLGGAVFVGGGHALSVIGGRFAGNSAAAEGGAISVHDGTAVLEDVVFEGNTGASGGGIHVGSNGAATVRRSHFCGNVATFGAAVQVANGGDLELTGVSTTGQSSVPLYLRGNGALNLSFLTVVESGEAIDANAQVPVTGAAIVSGQSSWNNLVFTDSVFDDAPPSGQAVMGGEEPWLPPECRAPIPPWQAVWLDGVAGSTDPDGTVGDAGATGGPLALPALWEDPDNDGVAAMWDCDSPLSNLSDCQADADTDA
ncbi:MAG: right-handed parallel beta-helix repeat-containing protein, partial [Alphaproteobacteria bacterium]|nr:right-handed parallel beta-helix repeat-containing protein [Alphaproteobacteria bacterium]